MGTLITLMTSVMDHAEKIKNDQRKDKLENDQRKKDNIIKPLAPPKYYSTIEARRKNVKSGPYSVDGISSSLKNDLIPVGYSLEQLRKIGFGADVTEYEMRHKNLRNEDEKNLIEGLKKIRKEIKKGFINRDDLSELDKNILEKNNSFNPSENQKYVNKIDGWLELARNDALSPDVLDNLISIFNSKLDGFQDALRTDELKKRNESLIDKAVLSRDKKVLDSVKRAFANGYGIKRF